MNNENIQTTNSLAENLIEAMAQTDKSLAILKEDREKILKEFNSQSIEELKAEREILRSQGDEILADVETLLNKTKNIKSKSAETPETNAINFNIKFLKKAIKADEKLIEKLNKDTYSLTKDSTKELLALLEEQKQAKQNLINKQGQDKLNLLYAQLEKLDKKGKELIKETKASIRKAKKLIS